MSGLSAATMISLGLSAVSTAAGFAGQLKQQEASQQQANQAQAQAVYQAQVARQNEAVAQRQAADALQRGLVAEMSRRTQLRQQLGSQLARLAGQGTDLEGSPADILGDTAAAGEQDAMTLRSNASREAYGYRLRAMGFGGEAALLAARTGNAASAGSTLGAGASLLAGASALAERWNRFK